MKKVSSILLISAAIIIALFLVILEGPEESTSIDPLNPNGDITYSKAPDFKVKSLNGHTFKLSELEGTIIVLNFWATWCPPCVAEIPDLNSLHNLHSNDVVVVGLSVDKNPNVLPAFIEKHGIDYPIMHAPQHLAAKFGDIRSIPTTFIIDRNMNLVRQVTGLNTYDQLVELITPFL